MNTLINRVKKYFINIPILRSFGAFVRRHAQWFLYSFIVLILADVFMLQTYKDVQLFLGIALWYLSVRARAFRSKITFQVVIALLLLMFVSYQISGTSIKTERLAVWLYLLFWFGVIQQWFESTK